MPIDNFTTDKYVGQEELIFSSVLNIGEIYKVHGCVYQPETMVLTKEDYNGFNDKSNHSIRQ